MAATSRYICAAAQVSAFCSTPRQISAAQRRARTWPIHAIMLLLAAWETLALLADFSPCFGDKGIHFNVICGFLRYWRRLFPNLRHFDGTSMERWALFLVLACGAFHSARSGQCTAGAIKTRTHALQPHARAFRYRLLRFVSEFNNLPWFGQTTKIYIILGFKDVPSLS